MSLRHLSVGKCLQTTSVVLKRNLFKLLLCCRYICVTEHSTNNSIFRKAVPSCPPPVSVREYFCKGSKGILMRNIFFFLNIFRVVPGSFFLLRRSCREITFRREWQKRERHLSLGWGRRCGGKAERGGVLLRCVLMKELIMRVMHLRARLLSEWEVHSLVPPPAYSYFLWSESVLYWNTQGNVRNNTNPVQVYGCCKARVYERFPRSLAISVISCILSCCKSHVDHSPPTDAADNLN